MRTILILFALCLSARADLIEYPAGNFNAIPVHYSTKVFLSNDDVVIGAGRTLTTLNNQCFSIREGTVSISNITLTADRNKLNPKAFFDISDPLLSDSSIIFENVDFISFLPFNEATSNGMVAVVIIRDTSNFTLRISFINCRFIGQSVVLYAGHPNNGDRKTRLNCTFDNCIIESSPIGIGPPDPHFIMQDWLPGSLTIRNCNIRWDMSQSTRGSDMHRGAILMQNEDGNGYIGTQRLEILNSKIEMIDNGQEGPGKPASLVCVAAQANKNRCTVLLENSILRRGANVPYGILTSNQSRVEYSQCNPLRPLILGGSAMLVNLDTEEAIKAGKAVIIGRKGERWE